MNIGYSAKYRVYVASRRSSNSFAVASTAKRAALMLRRGRQPQDIKRPHRRSTLTIRGL
jgi:hypothetical protein